MRPRVVASVLLLAVFFLGLAVLLSKILTPKASPPAGTAEAAVVADPKPNYLQKQGLAATVGSTNQVAFAKANLASETPGFPVATNGHAPNTVDQENAKRIHKRVLELYDLAMKDDTASRDEILSELKNPEKKIRHAALEAAIQFDDRSVVPYLKDAVAQTEDPREKVAILDAIDYINLPSLTEYAAQRKALGLPAAPPSTNFLRKPFVPRQNRRQ